MCCSSLNSLKTTNLFANVNISKTYENMTDHFTDLILKIFNAIYSYPSSDLLRLYCYVQEKAVLHHRIIGTSGCLIY